MFSPAITLNLHFCRKLVIFDARLFPPPTKFAPANVSDWIWRPLAPSNQPPLPNISIKSFGLKYIYADLDPWFQCVKYFSVEIDMTGLAIGWDWVSLYNSSKLPSNHSSQLLSNCLLIVQKHQENAFYMWTIGICRICGPLQYAYIIVKWPLDFCWWTH